MYQRSPNTREHWTTVTDPSLSALAGSMLVVTLGSLAVAYLATHLALAGGLLLGIGLSYLRSRLAGWEPGSSRPSNQPQTAEIPVWFDGVDGRPQSTTRSSAD